jgi:predicted dehydrogenase
VLASKDVDAVYIPLPTGIRKEWVIRAAEAGKHVVCEKPCALNAADLQQMIAACRKNRVQFMDGVMFMHHPRMEQMRRAIDDHSAFGAIKRIMSVFSFRGGEDFVRGNIRTHGELEPAGSLGDLGWYCIRFILWAMHWQLPRAVAGRTLTESQVRGPRAVPMDFSGEMIFEGGASAGFFSSFLVANQQWVNISGTKGSLRVADFVHTANDLQSEFELDNKMMQVESGTNGAVGDDVAQQTRLFRNFSNQVASGKLEASWPEMALITQRVMDACLESARDGSRTIELRK